MAVLVDFLWLVQSLVSVLVRIFVDAKSRLILFLDAIKHGFQ